MAPRIERLFDHTARIWRATVSKDNLGAESRAYTVVDSVGLAINRSVAPVGRAGGGGLTPIGRLRMYLKPDIDVQARDIIELVTGPSSTGTWEVDEPPVRPRGHHTQLDCIAWRGTLAGSES